MVSGLDGPCLHVHLAPKRPLAPAPLSVVRKITRGHYLRSRYFAVFSVFPVGDFLFLFFSLKGERMGASEEGGSEDSSLLFTAYFEHLS